MNIFLSWSKQSLSSSFQAWIGFSFEILCLKHINQIKTQSRIDHIYSINNSWFNEKFQIEHLCNNDYSLWPAAKQIQSGNYPKQHHLSRPLFQLINGPRKSKKAP